VPNFRPNGFCVGAYPRILEFVFVKIPKGSVYSPNRVLSFMKIRSPVIAGCDDEKKDINYNISPEAPVRPILTKLAFSEMFVA
jgi:hypothetical protein